ncbi:MAG: tRNA epoxyqueuosine(34) reductase QueG [Gemmatimonadetes bacterium]|nr:tRNA epoxyqueuosine(34) reductase QueG [Gemmatimonadota bacterium]MXX35832.1 tRNA epoxyqueuosine(34) reductase QueG [Gemmatimonadota bacterium]MYA13045.1 tRNA epoxyqueuosine(34) reductase QueG [Gemmatimonadota bacterium]MYD13936.1 tRNA epoxyqueuosine(34) reductase QueG [Gemmatimonadota bacterium]MYE70305.1 tRNA epoxyqueuosine(34) reductase QueG [Gemmatimonadota bacterium]
MVDTKSLASEGAIALARALGFEMAGVVTRRRSRHLGHFRAWLESRLHGTMAYLERPDAVLRRGRLDLTLPAFRSALVVAHSYAGPHPATSPGDPSRAIIARYARGRDYHHVIAERLEELGRGLELASARPVARRAYVDTGPILERELAALAGLGWFGKNTMLIHPRRGSYFFIGVLLTDLPLVSSAPFREEHCGTCTRCLDACPTGALLGRDDSGAPVMDAARCISYLTIELRGAIPEELRPAIGNRVFGCDICQEVCPWNARFATPTTESAYTPRADLDGASLVDLAMRLLDMSGKAFQREFADSPLSRARRNGLLRNVCVALGNWGAPEAVPVLERAARDRSSLVREHAEWALGRIQAG